MATNKEKNQKKEEEESKPASEVNEKEDTKTEAYKAKAEKEHKKAMKYKRKAGLKDKQVKDLKKEINNSSKKYNETLKKMQDQIDRLMFAADKSQLHRYDSQHEGKEVKTCHIGKIKNAGKWKYITGWKSMSRNDVTKDKNGNWSEDLRTILEFADDTTANWDYLDWQRQMKKVQCDIISKTIESNGDIIYKVKFPSGETEKINAKFINP